MNESSLSNDLGDSGKMALVDKVERLICDRNLMFVTADVSFFTTFACRLFKSNYYYLSIKLLHCGSEPGLVRGLKDAQNEFITGLRILGTEGPMKAYPAWTQIGNTLREIRLVDVRYIAPGCRYLAETFRTLDAYLIPVYLAQTHKLISGSESKVIADKVKVLYGTMLRRFSEQVIPFSLHW